VTEIDWETAEVKDGKLRVSLTEAPPKEWRERAAEVAELLAERGRVRWGELSVQKDALGVDGIGEGDEADVRHYLESIVLEANASVDGGEAEDDTAADEDADSPDRRMTDAFRDFAS
jgi:hypothetical protein